MSKQDRLIRLDIIYTNIKRSSYNIYLTYITAVSIKANGGKKASTAVTVTTNGKHLSILFVRKKMESPPIQL